MDLPIEIFLSFIGFSMVMGIVGLWKKVPFLMFIAGGLITFWAITTDNIIMGNIVEGSITSEQVTSNTTDYQYNVESSTTNSTNAYFTGMQYGQSENPTGTSIMLNSLVQCIDLRLAKVGSPTGTITVGVFTSSSNVTITSFGTMTSNSLTTSLEWYSFCLPDSQEVITTAGNRYGFVVSGGNSTNYVLTRYSTANPFDGANTLRTFLAFGTSTWSNAGTSTHDMTMRLYDLIPNVEIVEEFDNQDNLSPFTEYPKILFGIMASIFMIAGALIWKLDE